MKRKIFTLLLSAMIVGAAFAQRPAGEIVKATTSPTIDGVVDEVWATANTYDITRPFQTEVPSLGDAGATNWKALWDADGFYLLLTVTDDQFWPNYAVTPAGNNWEYDKPEIYFDVNYLLEDAIGGGGGQGHYQVAPGFTLDKNDGTVFTGTDGVAYAFMVEEPNYIGEYFIPWSKLLDKDGIQVDLTGTVGFDVTIIDREEGDAARKRAVWANDGTAGAATESWNNMDECGTITFLGAESGVDVETINLTGGAITEDNGTFQIVAEVLPADATIKKLLWKVDGDNSTGSASVDANGLVTAIKNGDVTIIASATDGSYVEASCVVAISGQVVTLAEVNVIKNGYFDMVETNGQATYWGGWGGDAGSAMPQIVDGVAVCTPVAAANNWQYQFSQSNLTALPNIDYVFKFQAWSDADRVGTVDFEDIPGNNYNRYGVSTDPESNGRSEWNFNMTTVPTNYTFHVNFDQMVATTVQKVQYMIAQTSDQVYLDSVMLVAVSDLSLAVPAQKSVSEFTVYPNPVVGNMLSVQLSVANSKITIYNSVGRKVEEVMAKGNIAKFDVSSYARGIYFVKVNDTVQKFVK